MPNPNPSASDRAVRLRIKKDLRKDQPGSHRGAYKKDRRAEYAGSKDPHGKTLRQWCYLCNGAHAYHRPGTSAPES